MPLTMTRAIELAQVNCSTAFDVDITYMLNVERLRALHAVAAQGSILAAADTLHVTTSAVSQQLAKLEREVGHPLLEKQGRGVRLTDSGRLLVAHTERVLCLLEPPKPSSTPPATP